MTDNRPYKLCFIFALILFLGLGLALVMPWLASSQSQAAQSDIEVLTSIIDLPERGNGIGVITSPEARTKLAPTYVTIYVATTGTGSSGLSWTDAFTNVQDALAVAVETSEIWIAEGVYYPDQGGGQIDNAVTSTFIMTDGVTLFGGFDTSDEFLTDRDWENNVTVLSGDIDGDDTTDTNGMVTDTLNINGNNAYHVVTGSGVTGTAVLDGFTITAGQANGSNTPNYYGGGFFCDGSGSGNECSPSLSNVTFSGNTAKWAGGAMYNDGHNGGISSPNLSDVIFSGNSAGVSGGAMYNDGDNGGTSSPTLRDVTFSGNLSFTNGGAIFNDGSYSGNSSPSLRDVIFSGNWADRKGGAILNYGDEGTSSPSLTNVTFSGNWTDQMGGAMYNDGNNNGTSSPNLRDVTFSGNTAKYLGGAMYNDGLNGSSSPSLTNVTFSGNWADIGGAMYNDGYNGSSSPTLGNVIFSGNSADWWGGAMYNDGSSSGTSSPSLSNVTFSGNSAHDYGGAMYNDGFNGTSSPEVRNSILWNNQDSSSTSTITATIYNNSATITLTHSLAQGTGGSISWIGGSYVDGGDNIDADPLFILDIDPSTAPTKTGNLRLGTGSPAIDAGNNTFAAGVLTDLDGEARIKDGDGDGTATVDMGAYEAAALFQLTVTKAGTGSGQVTSSPPGIDCGDTCSVILKEDSTITLTAIPDEGSTFTGWSGACSGTAACEVTMDAAKSVTATFMITEYDVFIPVIMK